MVAWAVAALALAAAPAWQEVGHGDVQVFTRSHPGERVAEFKAVKIMDASAVEIRDVLDDDNFARQNPHMVEFRVLDHPAPNVWIRYGRVSFPFFKDRDYFVQTTVERDLAPDGTGRYHASWQPWGLDKPTRANVVRVKRTEGYWDVEPLPDGRARVEYYVFADPDGSIPGWAIDLANRHVIPDMLRDLEREAIRRRNQGH